MVIASKELLQRWRWIEEEDDDGCACCCGCKDEEDELVCCLCATKDLLSSSIYFVVSGRAARAYVLCVVYVG